MFAPIGKAVEEISDFFNDPWRRIEVTVPAILYMIYAPTPAEVARVGLGIRKFHTGRNGEYGPEDENGQRRKYNALDRVPYAFAHFTFERMIFEGIRRFSPQQLTPDQQEQLHLQCNEWGRREGVAECMLPQTKEDFDEVIRDYYDELEMTPAAEHTLDLLTTRKLPRPELVITSEETWERIQRPFSAAMDILTRGGLTPEVQKKFGLELSLKERLILKGIERAISTMWHRLPRSLQLQPVAREAIAPAAENKSRIVRWLCAKVDATTREMKWAQRPQEPAANGVEHPLVSGD